MGGRRTSLPAASAAHQKALSINKGYFDDLAQCIQSLERAKWLDRVADPIAIASGGQGSPFSSSEFNKCMKQSRPYFCAINVGWVNETWTPLPGIPLSKEKVKLLMRPEPYEVHLQIAVPSEGFDPTSSKGALQCVSPIEELHGWIWSTHEAYAQHKSEKACMTQWQKASRSMPVTFRLIANSTDAHYFNHNYRWEEKAKALVFAPAPLQRVFEVHLFKRQHAEILNASVPVSKIVGMLLTHAPAMDKTTTDDKLSATFITQALEL